MEVKVFPVQMLIIYTLLFYFCHPQMRFGKVITMLARVNLVENVDKVAVIFQLVCNLIEITGSKNTLLILNTCLLRT
jgi:hypothetical protein